MEDLKKLLSFQSVSGSEDVYCENLKDMMKKSFSEVHSDTCGNVFGIRGNGKRKLVIDAHWDIIGLMVTKIEKDGLISFTTVGGVDTRILPALSVTIHGKEKVKGVIGVPPPHLLSGDTDKPYEPEILKIDTGYTKEQLSKLVETGDLISFDSVYTELLNGRFSANGLDNKLGVYCAIKAAEKTTADGVSVAVAATCGEEINLNGARVAANSDEFELAIIIDVTHGETPDSKEDLTFEIGNGPTIAVGPGLSNMYSKMLIEVARENKIPYAVEVTSGSTGTNSLAYEVAGNGIPCVVVSVPLRYMHTAYEVADIKDVSNTIKLVSEFINRFAEVEIC